MSNADINDYLGKLVVVTDKSESFLYVQKPGSPGPSPIVLLRPNVDLADESMHQATHFLVQVKKLVSNSRIIVRGIPGEVQGVRGLFVYDASLAPAGAGT